jgi:BirA family biotin operon repressor/biotin-[acetyl-CoA-carboxylase] ligase
VSSQPFDLRHVEQVITGTEFAGCLYHLPTVPSTNDFAAKAAQSGARHGVWIAEEQTAGRGRGGHTWHSAPGDGLYMTALVSPRIPVESALRLSLITAMAVQTAISQAFGFHAPGEIDIRWPNDLILKRRKCGGILIETSSHSPPVYGQAMLRYALIGIGINVNHTEFPPELESIATSLRREITGPSQPLAREPLAAAVLIALDCQLRRLASDNGRRAADNLALHSTWISGKRVFVQPTGTTPGYTGVTAGLDPSGFLLVHGDDGQLHTVLSGGLREP